jgi:putative oxidoreductase
MRKAFNTNTNSDTLNFWLLLLRIAIACFMLTHGWPKVEKVMAGNFQFGDPFGIGSKPSLILSVFAEAGCSVLILIGLFTRLATIPLIINMAVAAFIALGQAPFAKKELALLYLLIYITIAVLGPGKYSADAARNRGFR